MKVELTLEEVEIIIEQFKDKPTYPNSFLNLGEYELAKKHERLRIVYQDITKKMEQAKLLMLKGE